MSEIKTSEKTQREQRYSEKDKIRLEKDSYDIQIESIDAKLEALNNKKQMLDFKRSISSFVFTTAASEKVNKNIQEMEKVNAEILELEQERCKLNNARKDAKNRLKAVSKKLKDDNKKTGGNISARVQKFSKDNKMVIVTFAGIFLMIVLCIIISNIVNGAKAAEERNRDYYITMDQDEYIFDCDIQETEYSLNCKKQKISGEFSKYDTTELEYSSMYEIAGNHFVQERQDYIYISDYQTENFDINNIKKTQSRSAYITLKNTFLNETVFTKTVDIKYNLSNSDLEIIAKAHDKWQKKEKQEEQKREEEARKKAEEGAAKKAQEEAEAKTRAEENKKQEQSQSNSSQNNKPSIDTIADACWAYGRNHGVHLTDYASDEITQEGDYYRIMMFHDDGSYWRCWYNPSNNDTFVEKAYNSPWR